MFDPLLQESTAGEVKALWWHGYEVQTIRTVIISPASQQEQEEGLDDFRRIVAPRGWRAQRLVDHKMMKQPGQKVMNEAPQERAQAGRPLI
jgi:hypothetical protein